MKNINTSSSHELIKKYSSPRGIDLGGACSPEDSFVFLQNMYIDHSVGGNAIESIPGYRKIFCGKGRIHSLAAMENCLIFHLNDGIYRLCAGDENATPLVRVQDSDSFIFGFGRLCIILDGDGLYLLRNNEVKLISKEKYIVGCKSATLFDGRLLLAGNNKYPGKIFFSSAIDEGDLVFSEDNFISVGGEINLMLSYADRLWIFRSSNNGECPIVCYSSKDGYKRLFSLGDLGNIGSAIAFKDRIFFIYKGGLWAIEDIRSDSPRLREMSGKVSALLSKEELDDACLCVWKSYLLISCNENAYLIDTKDERWDWYFLSGIGGHTGDRQAYRYSYEAEEDYLVHKNRGRIVDGEVYSLMNENGKTIYFTKEANKCYAVYPTSEKIGGRLLPAERYHSNQELLYFSAGECIYLFNDKDVHSERKAVADYYSFDGHAPTYVISTHFDDFGNFTKEKSSVGDSLHLKLKLLSDADLKIRVITDKGIASEQIIRLKAIESAEAEKIHHIRVAERAHGWIEKRIEISAEEFSSAFGLYSLACKYQQTDF